MSGQDNSKGGIKSNSWTTRIINWFKTLKKSIKPNFWSLIVTFIVGLLTSGIVGRYYYCKQKKRIKSKRLKFQH